MNIILLGKSLKEKRIEYSLTSFYGIGLVTSKKILADLKIEPSIKPSNLDNESLSLLTTFLRDKILIEANLRNHVKGKCLDLVKKGCYRGKRHVRKLPVRGQRTSTNARTNRRLARRYVL